MKEEYNKNSFGAKAAKSFVDFSSPHKLMIIYGADKGARQRFSIAVHYKSITQNQDKDIVFVGAGTLEEIGSLIDEPSDILIMSELQEWVFDSTKLLELLSVYMDSMDKRLLMISDRHPSKLVNMDEKCKSVLQTFLIADM